MNEELLTNNDEIIVEEPETTELMELETEEPEIESEEDGDSSNVVGAVAAIAVGAAAVYGGYRFTKDKVIPAVKGGANWIKGKLPFGKKKAIIEDEAGNPIGETEWEEEFFEDDQEEVVKTSK